MCKQCGRTILITKGKTLYKDVCSLACSKDYNDELLEKNGCIDKENIVVGNSNCKFDVPLKDY
jgi:hypothetical protein